MSAVPSHVTTVVNHVVSAIAHVTIGHIINSALQSHAIARVQRRIFFVSSGFFAIHSVTLVITGVIVVRRSERTGIRAVPIFSHTSHRVVLSFCICHSNVCD